MGFRVVAIGEVLWDRLPDGRRILGGAPCNVACHALALGGEASLITRVGDDAIGAEIMDEIRERGLPTSGISIDPQAPTGTVDVQIDEEGHARYVIYDNVAWDRLQVTGVALELASTADATCFGSLAQRDGPPPQPQQQSTARSMPPSSGRSSPVIISPASDCQARQNSLPDLGRRVRRWGVRSKTFSAKALSNDAPALALTSSQAAPPRARARSA